VEVVLTCKLDPRYKHSIIGVTLEWSCIDPQRLREMHSSCSALPLRNATDISLERPQSVLVTFSLGGETALTVALLGCPIPGGFWRSGCGRILADTRATLHPLSAAGHESPAYLMMEEAPQWLAFTANHFSATDPAVIHRFTHRSAIAGSQCSWCRHKQTQQSLTDGMTPSLYSLPLRPGSPR